MKGKVVVTGGAGFIGSNLTEELVRRGFDVKVIDNLTTGNIRNLEAVKDKITFIKGDIRNFELLKNEFRNTEYVFHQAALTSVPESIDNPILVNDVNANGTLNVLIAARDCNVKRVIFASSCAVYGNHEEKINEKLQTEPISPYAVTKSVGEYYSKIFHRVYGLETVSLRYFNVFGPKQNPDSEYAAVIPNFIKKIMNELQPVIFGDGTQTRDFIFVQNVVDANILACKIKNSGGEAFNIGSGSPTNLLSLVASINKVLGKKINPYFTKPKQGDIKHSLADISKAKKILGYEPRISFEEGLKKTIQHYAN